MEVRQVHLTRESCFEKKGTRRVWLSCGHYAHLPERRCGGVEPNGLDQSGVNGSAVCENVVNDLSDFDNGDGMSAPPQLHTDVKSGEDSF